MNKYDKTLENIANYGVHMPEWDFMKEAFDKAQKHDEMMTPKKPIYFGFYGVRKCPNCSTELWESNGDKTKHCVNCGQHIDWSE